MVLTRMLFSYVVSVVIGFLIVFGSLAFAPVALADGSFLYTFNSAGTLTEAPSASQSSSPYFWLKSGGELVIANGRGDTLEDTRSEPQNAFLLLTKASLQSGTTQAYFDRTKDNLSNLANREPYIGEGLFARYQNDDTYYYASVRADGLAVIKRKSGGVYTTLATAQIFPGTYSASKNPDLIPLDTWVGLKFTVTDTANGTQLSLSTDLGWTGNWKLAASATDTSAERITESGVAGIESDYANATFDNFEMSPSTSVPAGSETYDSLVLSGNPVLYLPMDSASSGKEPDESGNGNTGTYKGGTPASATLPNGDVVADFNGSSEYLTVPSNPDFSISKTGKLTWEAWIRPDTFSFPTASDDGYVDWMGKCENYSPNCEWEARIYGNDTSQDRSDRLSAYVFNPSAGLGSAADWQPSSTLSAGQWIHVVAEYDTTSTPAGCDPTYPGTIAIWVDGVEQNFADHAPTGCMSQYAVTPKAGNSPLTIGTMALDTWFKGAVGKVAIYDRLLSQSEIDSHFTAMTGQMPAGSCGDTCTASMP